jgi:nicotinamide-nucleotide adenylyltransferase
MNDKPACLFVGRFQPFHNGHLLVVEGMTKMCSRVVIAIGSAGEKETAENPFSVNERKEMIQRALQGKDIIPKYDVEFVEVPDMASDADWTKHVLEKSGNVHKLWTGNPDTKKCFEGSGLEIQTIKEIPGISGTDIRKSMKAGDDWKEKVPPEVASYMGEIGGVERVKKMD